MSGLDLRTVMFFSAMLMVLCLVVTGLLWRQSRARYDGMDLVFANFVIQVAGLVFIALTGAVSGYLSIALGNSLVLFGSILGLMGLERFVGKARSQTFNFILLAVYAVLLCYFVAAGTPIPTRLPVILMTLMIVWVQVAWLMLVRVDAPLRRMTRDVGIVFTSLSLVNVARAIDAWFNPELLGEVLQGGPTETFLLMLSGILAVASVVFAALMVNSRLAQDLVDQEKELSLHDELTGLYNRRGFFALAKQVVREATRLRTTVHLVFMDCDGLKKVNDTLGHDDGDRLLRAAANLLASTFRESDVVARMGGDEYAVCFLESDGYVPEVIFSRLEDKMAAINADNVLGFPLSLSWGTAVLDPASGDSLESVLKLADERMYEQKQAKRASKK